MRFLKVKVIKSAKTPSVATVSAWEVPILQMIHGSGQVSVIGEVEVSRDYPEPDSEMNRLSVRYGTTSDGGEPKNVTAEVYGHDSSRLAQALEQERQLAAARRHRHVFGACLAVFDMHRHGLEPAAFASLVGFKETSHAYHTEGRST